MKTVKLLSTAVVLFFTTTAMAQESPGQCEKVEVIAAKHYQQTRGKSSVKFKTDIPQAGRSYLGIAKPAPKAKTRGVASSCLTAIHNLSVSDIDVYVDSTYMGSVRASSVGYLESISSYKQIECVNKDKAEYWKMKGNCSCLYVFKLEAEQAQAQPAIEAAPVQK